MRAHVTLKIEEIEAISNGEHTDPFSVLGFHHVTENNREKLLLRCFRPDAKEVEINPARGKKVRMNRLSEEGLFEYIFPRRKKRFRFSYLITPWSGDPFVIEDPYRFGPLLRDLVLLLWGVGNHHRAYGMMGARVKSVGGCRGTHFVVIGSRG